MLTSTITYKTIVMQHWDTLVCSQGLFTTFSLSLSLRATVPLPLSSQHHHFRSHHFHSHHFRNCSSSFLSVTNTTSSSCSAAIINIIYASILIRNIPIIITSTVSLYCMTSSINFISRSCGGIKRYNDTLIQ